MRAKLSLTREFLDKCQAFRRSIGKTQADVAADLGCHVNTVSTFERGHDNNAVILLWYFEKGMMVNE